MLFATENLNIFQFAKNWSSKASFMGLWKKPLAGRLVVDRYNGYNEVPLQIQYCYAHLLRDVEELEKDFPDNGGVSAFTSVVIPLLNSAIKLRKQPIDNVEF
jgi:transposase